MLKWLQKKIIGSKNDREIKRLNPLVEVINQKEEEYQKLSDEELVSKTQSFKDRLNKGETLEDIKVEAFAVVKNACRRLCGQKWLVCDHEIEWNMVPFDVQIIGGLALHDGKIAEMATGEGKTLVATFPLYLNALSGQNVQLVTVNEYLARRDSEWVGQVFKFLGLTVGYIRNDMSPSEKREIYNRDILYGTASELGFDYLRDNGMAQTKEHQVQRSHYYCIIDEVDSVLIDEARTPLIISGPVETSNAHHYKSLNPRVSELVKAQNLLCNEKITRAMELLKEDIKDEEGADLLYSVGIGAPKNRRFSKLMEEPKFKRVYESWSTLMMSDMKKHENQALKEELFFVIEEKQNQVNLTERGRDSLSLSSDPEEFAVPDLVTFYQEMDERDDISDEEKQKIRDDFQKEYEVKLEKIHIVSQLLKAYSLFEKDVSYVVQENKVMIVDEYTGRLQPGRRFSEGLHQALEAKEKVSIERETQTLASVTIQNYFRLYEKLAGMTGTAETEADEFYQIYKMEVLVIPTNVPILRDDMNDIIYKTRREKFNAIIDDVIEKQREGRPTLVGTSSVETSELLSRLMKRKKIFHSVLNAKIHQKEAEIVSEAGKPGKVTIATNMAGRGTDIKLGDGVKAAGGLHIIGSERHESRRIDRQLRGRAGRQGDPGSSVFFISLEDDLMRLFGSDRMVNIMEKLGMEEGQDLQHPFLNKAIERAQKKVEERNFGIRKHTLEFDDVMNQQRSIVYENRNYVLSEDDLKELVLEYMGEAVDIVIDEAMDGSEEAIDMDAIKTQFIARWPMFPFPEATEALKNLDEVRENLKKYICGLYERKEEFEGAENLRDMEKYVCLDSIDRLWKEHLRTMDDIREDSYLRQWGQRDPLQEYKKAAFIEFDDLMIRIKLDTATELFKLTSIRNHELEEMLASNLNFQHDILEGYAGGGTAGKGEESSMSPAPPLPGQSKPVNRPITNDAPKVGRNDPCPCGSGKKYKKCCGR